MGLLTNSSNLCLTCSKTAEYYLAYLTFFDLFHHMLVAKLQLCSDFSFLFGLQTEMTFTQGYSDNVQCPETFSSESEIVSNPGSNAGFVKYYALGGSAFPDC